MIGHSGLVVVLALAAMGLAVQGGVEWLPLLAEHQGVGPMVGRIPSLVVATLVWSGLALILIVRSGAKSGAVNLALFLAGMAVLIGDDAATIQLWDGLSALGFVALGALVRFSVLFPEPLTPDTLAELHPPRSRIGTVFRALAVRALHPGSVWSVALALSFVTVASRYSRGIVNLLGESIAALGVLAALSLSLIGLHFSYLAAAPSGRKKILWLTFGLVLFATVSIFMTLMSAAELMSSSFRFPDWVFGIGEQVMLYSVPLGVSLAIFLTGAFNPALVIRWTTVYGVLALVFVFLVAGLGNAVSEVVEGHLGLPGFVGSFVYGGAVAILLLPVRSRLTRALEPYIRRIERATDE